MKHLFFFCLSILLFTACSNPDKLDFDLKLDPSVLGKIIADNPTSGYKDYIYSISVSENGQNYYTTNTYDYKGGLSANFYLQENYFVKVELSAKNRGNIEYIEKIIVVDNCPTTVTIAKVVVNSLTEKDKYGLYWDEVKTDAPDLTLNTSELRRGNFSYYKVDDNVSIFPHTFTFHTPITKDEIGPQAYPFWIEVGEYDYHTPPNGYGETILGEEFNPYHYTHQYNNGLDSNYPSTVSFNNEYITYTIHLDWK